MPAPATPSPAQAGPDLELEGARRPTDAPAAAAASISALELDAAISSWPAVLDLVNGQNSMLATALAAARPVAVGEGELTLAFPGGASFLKRKAEQDEHRRVAAEALKTVTGHRVALRYELREDEEESEPAGEPALSGEELVRRFLDEFDAEEIPGDETELQNEGEASG
jgi:DNA polymerase-3 subunit gamma/tau